MNRYLSSFIIAFILYTSALATIFYFINQNKSCHSKCHCEKMHKINIAMISPIQTDVTQVKKEKKVEPKPKPAEKPKPKPKHIEKPTSQPKLKPQPIVKEIPKSIPLKTKEAKPQPKAEAVSEEESMTVEEEIEPQVEEVIEQVTLQETTQESSTSKSQETEILQAKQNQFLATLIEKINANKSYPNMARRRCMEGVVDVKFVVLADGSVKDIEIVSGKRIFKKATIQAISRSFPIEVDATLFSFPKEFKIKISYILR